MTLPSPSKSLTFAVFLLSLLAACGGLGGEPQIVATVPPEPTINPDVGYPLVPPDIARGAQLYADNCTRCHGSNGESDGEFVSSGEVPQMASFRDPATAHDQTPRQWFNTITEGRLDKLMPPWREELNETDRWAVALYTYTMAYTPDQIAEGNILWDWDQTPVKKSSIDTSDQPAMVERSDQMLVGLLSPEDGGGLTDDQWNAVAAYARTRTVANPGVITQPLVAQPQTTPDPESTAQVSEVQGTVSGRVTNGTSASTIPADLQITLLVSDQGNLVTQEQVIAHSDGTYTFENVPIFDGATYVTAVVYRERVFTSAFVQGDVSIMTMDLPITIYELTEDSAVLSISGVVTQVSAIGDTLEVRQVIQFKNSSDRLFTTSVDVGQNQFASILITLPPGSQVISFGDQNRYAPADDDFSFLDTAPVFPGDDHLVVVVYIMPYDGSAALIEQPMHYPLDGQVRLLAYPQSLSIKSDQLPLIGPETVGAETYQSYGATLQLAPEDVIRYEISGAAVAAAEAVTGTSTSATNSNVIPVLLAIIGIAAILTGGLLYLRSRQTAPLSKDQVIDALVRQIAELDEAHTAGNLNHDVWQRQRAQLKARLAELLGSAKEE